MKRRTFLAVLKKSALIKMRFRIFFIKLFHKKASPKRILKILKENGWDLERIKGSHHIFTKYNESVPVPILENQDLKRGTFFAILKKSALIKMRFGIFSLSYFTKKPLKII